MVKRLLSLIVSIIFLFFCVLPAFAEEAPYSIAYDLTYTVEADGITKARQDIVITNLIDGIHIPEYSILISSTNISDVLASDNFGPIEPTIEEVDNVTKINLDFKERVVGKGNKRRINLRYTTPDYAYVKGKVMEAGFPLFADLDNLKEYNVTVRVAKTFGEATEVFPVASWTQTINGYYEFHYDLEQINGYSGINATFGKEQLYDFKLRYTVSNPHDIKGRTEIALPPDTNFQQILYSNINPKPQKVKVDMDGNWLAEYLLEPQSTLEILAEGKVKVTLEPDPSFARELSADEISIYTQADDYWILSDPDAQELANKLNTPENIYNYLVDEFIYDYGRLDGDIKRFGSEYALDNPANAICMEFTDTFITLTRLLGIPAREHNGYAYTENNTLRPLSLSDDVLHAWPEYYDQETMQWVQVDPTWGNSTGGIDYFHKFDLDHFTFIIHGEDNSYPIPAGAYKTDETSGKDLDITFTDTFEPVESVDLVSTGFSSGLTGIPVIGDISVVNNGNAAMYDVDVDVIVMKDEQVYDRAHRTIDVIPPFGSSTLPFDLETNWTDYGGYYDVIISVLDEKDTHNFELKPVIKIDYIFWAFGGIIGGTLWSIGYYRFLINADLKKVLQKLRNKNIRHTSHQSNTLIPNPKDQSADPLPNR